MILLIGVKFVINSRQPRAGTSRIAYAPASALWYLLFKLPVSGIKVHAICVAADTTIKNPKIHGVLNSGMNHLKKNNSNIVKASAKRAK